MHYRTIIKYKPNLFGNKDKKTIKQNQLYSINEYSLLFIMNSHTNTFIFLLLNDYYLIEYDTSTVILSYIIYKDYSHRFDIQ
jgi:hypothetical protein